jgi:serine/threonine-protein kinase PknK
MTAELDEDSGIRLLLASDSDEERERGYRRATELLAGTDVDRRPLAVLNARLLLIDALTVTGRTDEANTELADVEAQLDGLGLSQLLVVNRG